MKEHAQVGTTKVSCHARYENVESYTLPGPPPQILFEELLAEEGA